MDMEGFWLSDKFRIRADRLNEEQHRKTWKKQMAEDLYTWSEHWSVYDIERLDDFADYWVVLRFIIFFPGPEGPPGLSR